MDETDIGRIRMGQKAQFTVDTYGDHPFAGRITDVYPKAEIRDNVVNYVSVVTFTPPNDRVLRPEMTTTIRIELDTRSGVLAVPIRAVRWEGGRAFVLAPRRTTTNGTGKNTENAVDRRWVTTGVAQDVALPYPREPGENALGARGTDDPVLGALGRVAGA